MRDVLKNKKGFTLVELLAVIVILALIMGIAVVAMSGVIENSKKNSALTTAASLIDGVRKKLMVDANLETGTTSYYFTNAILERGGVTSPLGGNYAYITPDSDGKVTGATKVTSGLYEITGTAPVCTASAKSYVTVTVADGSPTTYTICLTSGATESYISGNENQLLQKDYTVIKNPTT